MTCAAIDWAPADRMLGQSIAYALTNVATVTPDLLARPTPCHGWDVRMLLLHSCGSMAALREGLADGRVSVAAGPLSVAAGPLGVAAGLAGPTPADCASGAADPVAAYTVSALWLLDCLANSARSDVRISGLTLPRGMVAAAGALEVAVHGWDVAEACGAGRPVPALLAGELLALAPLLVPNAGREPLFGDPVRVDRDASPSEQLTAFLGRVAALPPGFG